MRPLTIFLSCAFAVAGLPLLLNASPDAVPSHTLTATDAKAAWDELHEAAHLPEAPAAWNVTPPTSAQLSSFYMPFVSALQDKAKDFYSKFPKDPRALDARIYEFRGTMLAFQLGAPDQRIHLDALEKSLTNDPAVTEDDRVKIHNSKLMMLLGVARDSEPSKARPLLKEILSDDPVPEEIKERAAGELSRLESVGKTFDLQFTALDGRDVDVAKLKGKVVLIDFWATWCRPCVAEVPNVKDTYDKYHAQGFEVVGISLDQEKEKLTRFVGEHKMEWPQFFDGLEFQNKFARQFGIDSIPAMMLVDKKGVLRDINAREDLGGKVTRLLAE